MGVVNSLFQGIKPKIGEPCNNCGICCMSQVCGNGSFVMGLVDELGKRADGRCPALIEADKGKYMCDIVRNPTKYIKHSKYPASVLSRNFAHLIGSGIGCDELLDDDSESEEWKLDELIEAMQSDTEWLRKSNIAIKVVYGI